MNKGVSEELRAEKIFLVSVEFLCLINNILYGKPSLCVLLGPQATETSKRKLEATLAKDPPAKPQEQEK